MIVEMMKFRRTPSEGRPMRITYVLILATTIKAQTIYECLFSKFN